MTFAPILKLLSERAGLDPASLGSAAVRDAVAGRLGDGDLAAYLKRLRDEPAELQALLDDVIVPETWFFRGGGLFLHLAEQVRAARRPCRALSLPCSTGEEPYSLGIALTEAGLPLAACSIDGADISGRNLEAARRGVYGELSFRQTDPAVRARHFRPVAGGWQIAEALRGHVRFLSGNILDPALLLFERPYDIVFCRNLFIYLTPAGRRQALLTLARLTAPGGLLCLGHAEPLAADELRFRRDGPAGYFLYRRSLTGGSLPALPAPAQRGACFQLASAPADEGKSETCPTKEPDSMEQARRRADAGELADALEMCRAIQARVGPTADVYSLQGIIHQARQDRPAAAAAFRKALYLAPDHREALTHLMLLCQLNGDRPQADLLRKRLDRLAAPGDDA